MRKKLLATLRTVTYPVDGLPTETTTEIYTTPRASDALIVRAVKAALGWENLQCRHVYVLGVLTVRPMDPRYPAVCWVTFEPYEEVN